MNQRSSFYDDENEDNINFKKNLFKYLYYWKYFLISIIVFIIFSFIFLRYSNKIYYSSAKIKIIDKKESSLELPSATDLLSNSKINLENEIEVIKSKPIIGEAIKNLNLQTSVIKIGDIMEKITVKYPFNIILKNNIDSIAEESYRINALENGFEILDLNNSDKTYRFKGTSTLLFKHNLPFEITGFSRKGFIDEKSEGYFINFLDFDQTVTFLKEKIDISQIGDKSDIIKLGFKSTNYDYANKILNEIINVFDRDGVKDRQLIHKRTIDFVNERYAFLSLELDSIEVIKQNFKTQNDLVDFTANSEISLEQIFKSEENIFSNENEISVTKFLIKSLSKSKIELLPSNIGIDNFEINSLISSYNELILSRKKLFLSAGANNPSVKQIDENINDLRQNIIFSLETHLEQLKNLERKLSKQFFDFDDQISNLPKKEKTLRAIERNQTIKEALYLFLLQRREEAEVSYAVTEPSIKVVEYSSSNKIPISPKSNLVYFGALIIGISLPLAVLYLLFLFNNKIYSKEQISELNLPISVLGEIPEITEQPNTTISSPNERTPLAESFRVLASNMKFLSANRDENIAEVLIVTSTVKGEGKTFTAVNLAYSRASLGKKVLLIGADLHNPQIHSYLEIEKNLNGLSNFLVDNTVDWKKSLLKPETTANCDVLIGGQIPPNPAQLLNNGNLEKLLNEAKKIYDYIIIDTPPCLLVSDTLSIRHLADQMLFVVRCNYTDINLLNYIKDLYEKKVIGDSSMIILNGLGVKGKYGYGYAYNYSYGYKYNYSYNYNYGYGYEYKAED